MTGGSRKSIDDAFRSPALSGAQPSAPVAKLSIPSPNSVVSHPIFFCSTRRAIMVAVIGLATEPRWYASSRVTFSGDPHRRTPTAAAATILPSTTSDAAKDGR
jgi:hypothetical protein